MSDKIVVLDFGSQYNQLIVRRIRELGVYSELIPHQIKAEDIRKDETIKGIILSGGPHSVYEENSFTIDKEILKLGIPVLGICYGMQLLNYLKEGIVTPGENKEYGVAEISVIKDHAFVRDVSKTTDVWMSHGDIVSKLSNDFVTLASSKHTPHAVVADDENRLYGIQFHPEVNDTIEGRTFLNNFITITGAEKTWKTQNFIEQEILNIQKNVGNDHVICGLSGGVDSSVVAALLKKAIDKQLTCIFIDHGLLRKGERELVEDTFTNHFNVDLVTVDAKDIFMSHLKGVSDPETKRKIIGKTFIDVFSEEAKKIEKAKYLAQGTLYTDIIESGTMHAQTIKSHHNVGGLPKDLNFKLIEPLKTLFKDEVRTLGLALGLPKEVVNRQPFPGPGLSIRIIGDLTDEKVFIAKETDAILREEILRHKLDIWQYFTVVTPVQAVGVKGDKRSYDYVVAIRGVKSIDGMTADFYPLPYDVLRIISTRMTNEVPGVGRVVYDVTSKPPATIEWE